MITGLNSPSINILVGVPGSGKSTFVLKYLESNSDAVVVSSDDILEEYAKKNGISYNQAWFEYRDQAEILFGKALLTAIKEKKTIIVDRTNMSVKARRKVLANVPKTYAKYATVFKISDTELVDRLNRRREETGKHIPDAAIKVMRESYVEPTEEEGFTSIQFVHA